MVNYVGFLKSEIVSLDEAETCRVDVDLGNFMSSAVMEGGAYILIGVGLMPRVRQDKGRNVMKKLVLGLSLIVAAGFLFFGVQKFGATNPIFSIIAEKSGISLFEPYIRIFTGVAEVIVAALILLPRTRLLGALGGLGLLAGAIGFHISPWLGIEVEGMGHGLFITALALTALTVTLFVVLRKEGYSLFSGLK